MAARIDDLMVLGQNISKTDLAKYLRDREVVLPRDFGGLGDGAANDRAAIQACFDRAAADGKFAVIPPGTWNVGAGVTLGGGARGLIMQGVIQYTGVANAAATVLTLGDGGTTRNGEKLYAGLQVVRQTQSDWDSEADIGVLVRNIDASVVDLRLVSGFTIGIRTLGDGRGVEDSTFHLLRLLNNRYGLDVRAETATAWNTSVRYYGGHFACATGINPTIDRYGIRFSRGAGGALRLPLGAGRHARVRRGGHLGPALAGAGRHQSARRHGRRLPAGRPRAGGARLVHPLRRARRRRLDHQHGPGGGAQHLAGRHLRSRRRGAVGRGDKAADPLTVGRSAPAAEEQVLRKRRDAEHQEHHHEKPKDAHPEHHPAAAHHAVHHILASFLPDRWGAPRRAQAKASTGTTIHCATGDRPSSNPPSRTTGISSE